MSELLHLLCLVSLISLTLALRVRSPALPSPPEVEALQRPVAEDEPLPTSGVKLMERGKEEGVMRVCVSAGLSVVSIVGLCYVFQVVAICVRERKVVAQVEDHAERERAADAAARERESRLERLLPRMND